MQLFGPGRCWIKKAGKEYAKVFKYCLHMLQEPRPAGFDGSWMCQYGQVVKVEVFNNLNFLLLVGRVGQGRAFGDVIQLAGLLVVILDSWFRIHGRSDAPDGHASWLRGAAGVRFPKSLGETDTISEAYLGNYEIHTASACHSITPCTDIMETRGVKH